MINFVIKKDGTKVPFDPEKIKSAVTAAASQAGFSPDEASNTAMKVLDSVIMAFGDREEVPTSEIKGKVLSDLDTMAPEVLAAWKKHDESMGK
jgi:transcriptional regulator NrdR family protein